MRILMPSIVDPEIARSGAATVTRNLVQLLEAPPLNAKIHCVAIRRSTNSAHRFRQATAIARSLVSTLPAKVAYTYSRDFRARVLDLTSRERYDLVMINGSDLLWLEPLLPADLPRLLVAHNVEHQLFASQLDLLGIGSLVMRPFLSRERRRLEQHEIRGVRGMRNVAFLSDTDAGQMKAAGVERCIVVPPMFGESVLRRTRRARTGERLELGFQGNLHWWPNRHALAWFIGDVLPRINRPVHLHVFGEGRVPVPADEALVTCHGPVPDVAEAWDGCDLMICPMTAGGGVSIKLAEAVFHGMPVLATPFATRGLPLGDDPGLVVREPEDWASFLQAVNPDELRQHRIAEAISRNFTFGAHRERLQGFVRSLA